MCNPPRTTARYWHALPNGRIQCDLCPRFCQLKEGQAGFCTVRICQDQQIILKSYGYTSGFSLDPIEKKPLYHFLPGSTTFSFGTVGCNLACRYCQNWKLSHSRQLSDLTVSATPLQIVEQAHHHGCRSVAYTYNDPVIAHEYILDIAQACRESGLYSLAVTAGYQCSSPREEFYRYIDAANVDLKSFNEQFYRQLTGGHLQPVLDTLLYLKQHTSVWLELTTLLIPGKNDSVSEITQLVEWVFEHLGATVPIHFTAFHPAWKMNTLPTTPLKTLLTARELALKAGLHYVYTGNFFNPATSHTYCPHCQNLLIKRIGTEIKIVGLTPEKHCQHCQKIWTGIF